jgi:hypothetical protein
MTPETTTHTFDEAEVQGIHFAMLRAARKAREEARKAGLTIPVWENGTVVRKHPDELEAANEGEVQAHSSQTHPIQPQ